MGTSLADTSRRIRRGVRRHGLLRALRLAPYLSEHPIWYELDLAADRPRRALPAAMRLRRAEPQDLDLVPDGLLRMKRAEAASLLTRSGPELWLVEEEGDVRFVCWLFHQGTPVSAAADAWLPLPDDVVCLEDSHVSPAARGRGVAPGAWCALADDLAAQGKGKLITKVDASNVASRRAVEKAGFVEVLPLAVRRIGPFWRVRATTEPQGPLAETLLEQLER